SNEYTGARSCIYRSPSLAGDNSPRSWLAHKGIPVNVARRFPGNIGEFRLPETLVDPKTARTHCAIQFRISRRACRIGHASGAWDVRVTAYYTISVSKR